VSELVVGAHDLVVESQQHVQARQVAADMTDATFIVHAQQPLLCCSDCLGYLFHEDSNSDNLPACTVTVAALAPVYLADPRLIAVPISRIRLTPRIRHGGRMPGGPTPARALATHKPVLFVKAGRLSPRH